MASYDDNDTDGEEFPPVEKHSADEWRALYLERCDMLADANMELREFRQTSKEIERELELENQRTEREKLQVRARLEKVELERDDWKMKFMTLQATYNTATSSLQRELDNLRRATWEYKAQVRELEIGNDDLERNERVVKSNLVELEEKYNRAIEEKTYMEHELLSKGAQEEEIQRLRDELRDTSLEVAILKDKEADLRQQLETRSSLGPSPMTSPSVHEADEDLQIDDLTVRRPHLSRPSSEADTTDSLERPPTPPPKPTTAIHKSVSRLPIAPASPSRIPAPRRTVGPGSISTPPVQEQPTRSKTAQRLADLGTRVRLLETRISSKGGAGRAVSNTFARMKEVAGASTSRRERDPPAAAAADGSPGGWVLVSDGSSGVDSSFAIVHPTPNSHSPAPGASGTRPLSSTSRSSASESFGRPSFDRRRSVDVNSPPPTSFSQRLAERERTLSQSVAPQRRPSSRLGASTATIRASESRRFPSRPQTPTFLPLPTQKQDFPRSSTAAQLDQDSVARSRSVRQTGLSSHQPTRAASMRTLSNATRPTSVPVAAPPVPPLPKGLERSSGMSNLAAFPSAASGSRIGRPSSVGVARRPTSVHAPPRSSPSVQNDDEEDMEELARQLASRPKVRARVGSSVHR